MVLYYSAKQCIISSHCNKNLRLPFEAKTYRSSSVQDNGKIVFPAWVETFTDHYFMAHWSRCTSLLCENATVNHFRCNVASLISTVQKATCHVKQTLIQYSVISHHNKQPAQTVSVFPETTNMVLLYLHAFHGFFVFSFKHNCIASEILYVMLSRHKQCPLKQYHGEESGNHQYCSW